MDAKILRAAVSAAIKVTITTTLVGCGGVVTSSGGGPGAEPTGGPAGSSGQGSSAESSGEPVGSGYPKSEPAAGGKPGAEATTAAAAPGGSAPLGGTPTTAEAGNAGAPNGGSADATCVGAEVDACYAFLAEAQPQTKFGDPLPAPYQACCQTLLSSLVNGELSYVCLSDNNAHFNSSARAVCCSDPASWSVYPACAPWGPPVPPELTLEALRDWQAAA